MRLLLASRYHDESFAYAASFPSPPGSCPLSRPSPLAGLRLYVDPNSQAAHQANVLRGAYPENAALLDKIAEQPQALWLGEWTPDVRRAAEEHVRAARSLGHLPVMVLYNIPRRDFSGGHSQGGLPSGAAYRRWVESPAGATAGGAAVVILEPDALPSARDLPAEAREQRLHLLADAVGALRRNPEVAVYVDAGHPAWVGAEEVSDLLKRAGVEAASGFALNVANYRTTEECLEYGREVSERVGGKHFVIDTSRNGAGPYLKASTEEQTWCNPPGRKLGRPPTTNTGDPLCDAFLWIKRPGESDGQCNGGPPAGEFWLEQALGYAQ